MEDTMDRMRVDEIIQRELDAGIMLGPFHRSWLNEKAPHKVKEYLRKAALHPEIVASRQGFTSMDVNDGATGAFGALNTSTSELSVVGSSQALINQFCAISGNDPKAGKVYKVNFTGKYSNTGTPTVIWNPRWGNSPTVATNIALGTGPTITTITGVTNLAVYGEFKFTILSSPPGATAGSGLGRGFVAMGIPVTNSQYAQTCMIGGTTATIDTTGQGTAGCGIQITIQWGTSSASNTFTLEDYILRSLN